MAVPHYDAIVIGAGISGIDAGVHFKQHNPGLTFAILERRQGLGGTWDLFKYPGIRSDSDMFTFGFSFKPWPSPKPIAPGADILAYVKETADEFGVTDHILFGTHVTRADWTTSSGRWHLATEDGRRFTCGFLFSCGGYYDYDTPHQPEFPGRERFAGHVVHPQHWGPADDAAYPGKRVAIIGSGATAITLLPNMVAGGAAHVTMVQRTPTYIFGQPERDLVAAGVQAVLPASVAHPILRWRAALWQQIIFNVMQRFPKQGKKALLAQARKEIGDAMTPEEFKKAFTPPYNPWDQRLCLTPASDFYRCIQRREASVVTGHIKTFTETGIEMTDGTAVEADVIVTATGLTLQRNFPMSTMAVTVDGEPYDVRSKMVYKGIMLSEVPNFAFVIGYTNASWTLKADIACMFVSRLLRKMQDEGAAYCVPRSTGAKVAADDESLMTLTSGYVQRAKDHMPKQGAESPWRTHQNYLYDYFAISWGSLDHPALDFVKKKEEEEEEEDEDIGRRATTPPPAAVMTSGGARRLPQPQARL